MKEIPLSGKSGYGLFAIVDDEDYEELSKYKWHAFKSRPTSATYAIRNPPNKKTTRRMHRLIMNPKKGEQVDHINGNGLDNRKSNLRICTNTQNQYNRKLNRRNKTGYKGVHWNKEKCKYRASIRHNKKLVFIGDFNSPIEAAKAYDEKALELFAEFAKTNKEMGLL